MLTRLGTGRVGVEGGDVVPLLGDVLLDSLPGLSHLVVSMMLWQIKKVVFKTDLLDDLNEGM